MTAAITVVFTLIQQLLPLLGSTGAASTGLVTTIIKILTTWLPMIVTEVEALYTPFKNIITQLQSGNAPLTDEQKADLKTLDAKVDAAFEAATAGLDPDVP